MKPLGFDDLRACDLCGSGVAGKTRDGMALDLRRIVIERHVLDQNAVNERVGLTMMLGGSEALAGAFASHANATALLAAHEFLVCNPCWYERLLLLDSETGKGKDIPVPEPTR